ncbi:hypothetical protein A3D23_03210 [candidate division WOR-1 bacterium RIFCSPHIGHO2_02_FULL_53_26]|nr:MAG: hypothetical protein A3D23_03210 [candidate division WOR-1 bacterium RIFCSPHIGHO2_02_FULL_53_26]
MLIKKFFITFFIFLILASATMGGTRIETKTSPNYLIILLHGINTPGFVFKGHGENGSDINNIPDNMKGFGDLLGYLRKNLGLDGYVYYYTFSQRDGHISNLARELGDRNHNNTAYQGSIMNHKGLADQPDIYPSDRTYAHLGYPAQINDLVNNIHTGKGNCWLEQARQDYIKWFQSDTNKINNPTKRPPTDAEIPQKYILIAHSMGGLVARTYLSSDYYNNDVAAIITIDSQHLGSDGAQALKKISEFYDSDQALGSLGAMLGISLVAFISNQDQIGMYSYLSGILLALGRGAVVDEFLTKGTLGWYPSQPGVQDMDPKGTFISDLNSKDFVEGNQPVRARFIYSGGVPTPSENLPLNRYMLGLSAVQTLFSSEYMNDIPMAGKLMALYLSEILGAIVNQNGDIYGTVKSQRGDGLATTNKGNIDFKTYSMTFGEDMDVFNDAFIGLNGALAISTMFIPADIWTKALIKFSITACWGAIVTDAFLQRKDEYLSAHGLAYKKVYEDKIIDRALEDFVTFGGKTNTLEVRSGISASTVSNSAEGYTPPEQTFVLLSNLDNNGNTMEAYHTVTIEAFVEGGPDQNQLFPIEVNGQKKWVSSVTVKELPTAFKGVIDTFLPKKLHRFNYSENFAAWRPIGEVDEWGNFTIKDLHFAEGSNVLAFDAESWIGNSVNKQFRVTANTIPQFVKGNVPELGASTNNVFQTISVEANKASYSADPSERIVVTSFLVDGIERTAEANVVSSQDTYAARARAQWTPTEPLSPGTHEVLVKFQSNVGVSQAIWSFNVDTISPAVSIGTLEAFAPRAPGKNLNIKYSTSDNLSQFLKDISIKLYRDDSPDETNFVTEITRVATQAAGEQFALWDGEKPDESYVDNGNYTVKIKASDQAGNVSASQAGLFVDSTPPVIAGVSVSPNPMTSKTSELSLSASVNEKSSVFIKLTNNSKKITTAYLTAATSGEGGYLAGYVWKYDDVFTKGLDDGIYSAEVTAKDDAGNESAPFILSNVKIDRTPPVIFGQLSDPFVLANVGASPYQATLRYRLSESNDVTDNKQPASKTLNVKVKIFNENTGAQILAQDAGGSLNAENTLPWNAADPSVGKGAYKFQITAYDGYGNYSTAYASCVKDGVAPAISCPEDNDEVSGTITVRGTAMDPDWANDRPFKQYSVYYKRGDTPATINPGPDWQTDLIEVPEIYRAPGSLNRNISVRPVQNDTTLAYFYTGSLSNDSYTILTVAEEDGGTKYASARTVTVKNDQLAGPGTAPIVSLGDLPAQIAFDGGNSLPISFTYGGKDLNAYVEVMKVSGAGTREAVFYKYFPKLTVNYYSGRPTYQTGNELGYFIWQDETGWHVRWNGEEGKEHRFNGSIIAMGTFSELNKIGDGVTQVSSLINWDRRMTGGEGGFDFKTTSTQLIITSSINNDSATYEDDYSSLVTPYFGMSKYQPASSPVIISGIANQTGSAGQTTNWNGKTEAGAFVDGGDYIVRVRAEGADGAGLTMIEKPIKISTPFELSNVKAQTSSFDPLGIQDRVTVSYNISKDARIFLKVFQAGSADPLSVIDEGIQLGKLNADHPHTISWRGNYPDQNGTQVVTSGEYVLKLIAIPVDGQSDAVETVVAPNIRIETGLVSNSASVKLDQIGSLMKFNGGDVYAAQGSSDYYWDARASGTYYPPVNYTYTLGVQGQQKASIYPYVPFAGILHRGFTRAFGKIKVKLKVHGWLYDKGLLGDFNPTGGSPATRDKDDVKRESDFEISASTPARITFSLPAPEFGWEGVTGADLNVSFESSSGFPLDDMMNNYVSATERGNTFAPSSKGIFKVNSKIRWVDVNRNFNRYCYVDLFISLADGFEYSRFTNRFVPWYGFVNKNHSSYEAFSQMKSYLQKLGFPGRNYFTDEAKTIETYKKEIVGEYDHSVYDPNSYKNDAGNPVKSRLDSKTTATVQGDTSPYAQASYLSGEYIEFIPITTPDQGEFSYGSGIVEKEYTVNGFKRIKLQIQPNSYPIEAKTNYRIPYSSGSNPAPTLKWPNDNADISEKNAVGLGRLAGLLIDPQSYNISNAAYEIDKDELITREAQYLGAHPELVKEGGWFKRRGVSGVLKYNKAGGNYLNSTETRLSELIDPPVEYVASYGYSDSDKTISGLDLSYNRENNRNSNINASVSASRYGQPWSSSDDPVLQGHAGGLIKGGPETFNAEKFSADGRSVPHLFWEAYRDNYLKYQTYGNEHSYRYAFLAENNNPASGKVVDNPDLVINDWQIIPEDEAGQANEDIEVLPADIRASDLDSTKHDFRTKLKYSAKEKRLVRLSGRAASPYELSYFDGQKWLTFATGDRREGVLAYWDVGRLCGKYTVLLKTAGAIDSKDVYIGEAIAGKVGGNASSAYRRAEVYFKPASFDKDEFASVTPVTQDIIDVRNKPIIVTHGPIVELKPSPYKFKTPADGEEGRPFLRFSYTADDLKDGYGIITSPGDPDWKTKTQDLWLHQITADGNLEPVQDTRQELLMDEATRQSYFAFEAAMDHFSDYTLLKGKFTLSAPILFADQYITNKETATIYGTAEPGSVVTLYAKTENVPPEVEKGEAYAARMNAEDKTGNFRFENIKLLQEGSNYLFVTSHLDGNKDVRTYSDVTVVKDTVPPSVEASQNLYAFSPNGDGKYDAVDYLLKANEAGKIFFNLRPSPRSGEGGPSPTAMVDEAVSAEANKELKLAWSKENFQLFRRDVLTGNWQLATDQPISEKLSDGAYHSNHPLSA